MATATIRMVAPFRSTDVTRFAIAASFPPVLLDAQRFDDCPEFLLVFGDVGVEHRGGHVLLPGQHELRRVVDGLEVVLQAFLDLADQAPVRVVVRRLRLTVDLRANRGLQGLELRRCLFRRRFVLGRDHGNGGELNVLDRRDQIGGRQRTGYDMIGQVAEGDGALPDLPDGKSADDGRGEEGEQEK